MNPGAPALYLVVNMNEDVINFNNRQSDDPAFGIVSWQRWDRPILPGTRDHLIEILRRDGVYDFGYDLTETIIPCEFVIKAASASLLRQYARAVAAWLNVPEVKPLIFGDEQNLFYMARPIGPVSANEIITLGLCRVTFLVPAGYAEAVTPNSQPAQFTFIRASVAYDSAGVEVPVNTPVWEVV